MQQLEGRIRTELNGIRHSKVFEMQFRGVSYVSIKITSSIAAKAHIPSRNRPKHLKSKGLCCLIPISASITDNILWWNLFCDWIKTVQFTQYACIFIKANIHVIFFVKDTYHFEKKQVAIKIMNLDYSRLGAQVHCICL